MNEVGFFHTLGNQYKFLLQALHSFDEGRVVLRFLSAFDYLVFVVLLTEELFLGDKLIIVIAHCS